MDAVRQRPVRRAGFTLLELLMVTVIISILIAIIVPAINGARLSAIEAGVRAELNQFEQAISQFKATYGVEPPSRICLCEEANDWSGDDPAARINRASRQRAIGFLRRMWPNFNFALDRDINNDGDSTDVLDLNAGECLVFFLGYATDSDPTAKVTYFANGFSKNPANPFALPAANSTGSREGPSMEFATNRFVDLDGDQMPEYCDSFSGQKTPLLYFSSYEGKGYDPLDWAGTAMDNPTQPEVPSQYADDDGPYYFPPVGSNPRKHYKPQGFQLISPGMDGVFGYGGAYDPQDSEVLLANRIDEHDNLTNFNSTRLKP